MVSISRPVIAHVVESISSIVDATALSPICNMLANALLADLERTISNLPSVDPDPIAMEELNIFSDSLAAFPTNMDCDDIWEVVLDPCFNRFLGFGKSVESITASLKGQKKSLVSMMKFLRDVTGRFHIDGALIEGKVRWLIKAIEMQCVVF